MSTPAGGVARPVKSATDGRAYRSHTAFRHSSGSTSRDDVVVSALRRAVADLEAELAAAAAGMRAAGIDPLVAERIASLRDQLRNQRAAITALARGNAHGVSIVKPSGFFGAGHIALKGVTAGSIALAGTTALDAMN